MTLSGNTNDDNGVRRAYDTVAKDYAAHLPDTRAEAPLDLAMVDAFAAQVAGTGVVLDAGCGTGRMSRYLADRGCQVEGVDLSPGMISEARRACPGLDFGVASLADLPFPDARFAGVLLWYSIIHTPPAGLPRIAAEASRVLRPGGWLLAGFQSGTGSRDVAPSYRRLGHEIVLERQLHLAEDVAAHLIAAGLTEDARLVRAARGSERDAQGFLLARSGTEPARGPDGQRPPETRSQ